jgi:uncharacterized protein
MSSIPHMRESPLVFECEGEQLVGILHHGTRRLGIVVIVGGPQYRVGSHRQFVLMARALAAHGYPVLRFDYRGMGDSDGTMRTFEEVGDDVRASVDAMMESVASLDGVVLWGLCDAASAALMYCAGDSRVKGVILANPWVRTVAGEARAYLRHYYLQRLLQKSFWRKVFTGGFNPVRSVRDLFGAAKQADVGSAATAGTNFIGRMLSGLQKFAGPVLLLISERDLTAREFTDLCSADAAWRKAVEKRVHRADLPGADHTFSSCEALDAATAQGLRWLEAIGR